MTCAFTKNKDQPGHPTSLSPHEKIMDEIFATHWMYVETDLTRMMPLYLL